MQENLTEGSRIPMPENTGKKCGKIKVVLGFIKEKLLYPFKYDLIYFILLWIVIAFPNCFSQLRQGNIVYTIYLMMLYYIIAYIVTLVINLSKVISLIMRPILLFLLSIFSLINMYCITVYGCMLSNDFIQIIAGTNPNEAKEYFETFVTWQQMLLLVISVVIIIAVCLFLAKKGQRKYGKTWVLTGGILIISIAGLYHNSAMIEEELSDKNRWNFTFEEVVDLRNHPTNPQIIEADSIHPTHIIIILGESFSPNHSSLYGYKKQTNPLLSEKVEDGNLIVFRNTTSPCTHTTAAFKYLLNTNQIEYKDGKQWYEYTNIIEVMNATGYHTAWISNQSEKGMYDNLPSGHSRLCKETLFLENDDNAPQYDGGLIGKAHSGKVKNAIFYHLMGQHEAFDQRYPKEYEHFKANDYADKSEHQREILAAYDNATLYNDFVVSSIMDLYKDKDAIVFYFSDHALDVFDTEPDYFGHSKMTKASQEQGKKIPFMIYVSPIFQEHHADKVKTIQDAVDKPFCADKFIYAVMDVAGYQFADNDDVRKYSPF